MSEVELSVVLTAHAEKPEWVKRAILSALKQIDPPPFEITVTLDKAANDTIEAVGEMVDLARESFQKEIAVFPVDYGDLGLSRNFGARASIGRYVAFLDCDDIFGCLWFKKAYEYARRLREERKEAGLEPDEFILHPEHLVMFGGDQFVHKSIGDDSPEFDAKDYVQWNNFAASSFAPRDTFLKHPYREMRNGWAYEDMEMHARTLAAGVSHRVVPDTMYGVRLKRDSSSMAFRYVQNHGLIPKCDLYDRRDLPDAKQEPVNGAEQSLSPEVHKQCLFMHYEIGEYQLQLHREMPIRRYPRQRVFADQAALRDSIFPAKHVVMVRELGAGGAEKYAIDYADALKQAGQDVVILETEPTTSIWLKRAEDLGIKVVRWQVIEKTLDANEAAYALRRALVQCELDSVFVCNSPIGWGLLHENAQVLAKRVFAASFAPIPFGHGFSSCPPLYFKGDLAPNLTIVTDNEQHAKRLTGFNPKMNVEVIPPRVTYSGPSKKSQIDKPRARILWAGRGTPEKRPDLLPALAAAMEKTADIHVWGDVKPLNAPENLKYRGPFNGFESIDGSYDCYLMTSMYEGCPNTACEAVLAGLPVVGPHVGALPAIADRTYQKFNPLEVAELIKWACVKPKDNEAKEKVQKWAEEFNVNVLKLVTG